MFSLRKLCTLAAALALISGESQAAYATRRLRTEASTDSSISIDGSGANVLPSSSESSSTIDDGSITAASSSSSIEPSISKAPHRRPSSRCKVKKDEDLPSSGSAISSTDGSSSSDDIVFPVSSSSSSSSDEVDYGSDSIDESGSSDYRK